MPDKYGFDHLVDRSVLTFKCIEVNCNTEGYAWEWPESRRKVHFLSHNYELNASGQPEISGPKKLTICRTCRNSFEQERKRGRPRVQCYACKP